MYVKRLLFALLPITFLIPPSLWAQPTAAFTADTTRGCNPFSLVVTFQDLSTGTPTSWLWEFGDATNSTSTLQNPTFLYSQPGCYDVSLTVTNGGGSNTITQSCFIEILPAPVPGFIADPNEGCSPLSVCLIDTSIANAASIVDWQWTLSDGSPGTGPNPCFNFVDAPDTLGVILTVTNSSGCRSTEIFQDVIIVYEPPILAFEPDVNSACNPPLEVNFSNNTQINGATNPVYTWHFPGGIILGGADSAVGFTPPPVTYSAPGQYDVSLIFQSGNGCLDTLTRTNLIGIGGVSADFSASATTICLGDTITFTDLSSGGVSTLEWDFGENPGIDGNGQIENYVYSSPGTYTVTLFANNPQCGDTLIRTDLITVNPVPQADFSVDRMEDCQPGIPFVFTDLSVGATNWAWDFGDSTSSTQQNPTHTYSDYGQYNVCLLVTNSEGCTDSVCTTVTVAPPNISFTTDPSRGCVPLSVNFTDNSTSIDSIISWQWDFGSATNALPPVSTAQNPSVDFNASGSYNVTLIVTTTNGCTDTVTVNSAVEVGDIPISTFTVDKDTVCINEDITFRADVDDPDWDYYWDFQYVDPGSFSELDDTATTVYPDTGLFSVALVVDYNGCTDTTIIDDLVYVSPPRAEFFLSDTVVCSVPSTVTIIDSSLGPADTYNWYVNGAFYSNQQDPPPLTVNAVGSYIITQTILNSLSGCTDTFSVALFAGNPVASFSTPDVFGCRAHDANFISTSQNVVGLLWDFEFPSSLVSIGGTSPSYTYQDTGLYSVRLVAVDAFGCSDTLDRNNYVQVVGPYADFSVTPPGGCPPLAVQFTDQTATTPNSTPVNWLWDFGDGNTSTQRNPSHTYINAGSFTVKLTVTDNNGCQDSLIVPDAVQVSFPIPDFTIADTSTCSGNLVNFVNTSLGLGMSFIWDFGDGDTSSAINPSHAYADTGFFDVSLTAIDANGCVDSIFVPNAVYIEPFEANFFGSPRQLICPPLQTQFTDSTIGNVAAWNWDFGDGFGSSTLQNPQYVYFFPGTYDVTLVATHEDGCQDTVVRQDYIQLAGPAGSFIIDKPSICLGDTVCLTIFTESAVSLSPVAWQDGEVTNIPNLSGVRDTLTVCHVYTSPGVYIPQVRVLDAGGCPVDLNVLTQDSIAVNRGPQAQISPVDTVGCLPFPVPFIDASIPGDSAIINWSWDFGDGDTSSIQNPVKIYFADSSYNVNLFITDAVGCSDSATTTVTTFQGIEGEFSVSDTVGCSPAAITFNDLSINGPATSWIWAFGDGDSLFGDPNPTHVYQNDGIYTVTLIVGDALGCTDTITKPNLIRLRHPEAILTSTAVAGCNPLVIDFYADQSTSDTTIVSYEWCLAEINTGQLSCSNTSVDSLSINFTEPGNYLMTVAVTDVYGCSDTSDAISINIDTRVVPEPIVMRNITVDDDVTLSMSWEPYTGQDFMAYAIHIMNGPNPGLVTTITDQNTTSYTDVFNNLDIRNNSYCFKVLVQNTCEEFSNINQTQEHCTIDLETVSGNDEILLNWNDYVGYTVGQYEVYRATSYDINTLVQIGVVSGNTTSFVDTAMFCRDSVTYRVLAVGFGSSDQRSYSDLSSNAPFHPVPVEASHIITATVIDDDYVEVSWTDYTGYRPGEYLVERSEDGITWDSLTQVPITTTLIQDTTALVDTASYFYRVFNIDACGDISAVGRIGRTIYLNATLGGAGTIPLLNWNHYQKWANGVLNYQIEIYNEQTELFEPVDILPGNNNRFDDNLSQLDQAMYCYRIVAYEVGGNSATSVSNVKCVIFGPEVYAPNAFTPNNDGRNEEFKVYVPNLRNGELTIYDRWGELIFRTSDPNGTGWDGTFKGRAVQEGVYVYVISGSGVDGTGFTRSGTVTLIR